MHSDEPTLDDLLNRQDLVEEIAQSIVHCTPPQVIGIHGDWGVGKTSTMQQIQWCLTADCPQQSKEEIEKARDPQKAHGEFKDIVQAVWFDAWRYQHEDAPVVALLHEIRAQLSWKHQITTSAKRRAAIAIRGALFSIEELTKKIGFQYSAFEKSNQHWESRNLTMSLPSHTLREHLREAISKLLPKAIADSPEPRLVVFIDDVDRCEPEVAYRLLEGLKVYLTLDNCVFVLGMNEKAVESAIEKRLSAISSPNNTKSFAAAYMEKLCQNVWQIPAIRNPAETLHTLLRETITYEDIRDWILMAVAKTPCLPSNPRKLKGLANLIGRLSRKFPNRDAIQSDEIGMIEASILMVVAYIYQFHADLYIRWESEPEFYDKIYDKCENPSTESNIDVLDSLAMPKHRLVAAVEPTRPRHIESLYPDPTAPNVFWIQPMVLKLESEVTSSQFIRYLHGESL